MPSAHGFLNSISAQKHTMVATGVGGCFDEPGKPCVQKSGGVITVAVVAPYDGTISIPPSSWVIVGDADDGDGGPLGDDFSGDGFSDNNTDAAGAGGIGSI